MGSPFSSCSAGWAWEKKAGLVSFSLSPHCVWRLWELLGTTPGVQLSPEPKANADPKEKKWNQGGLQSGTP